MTTQATSVLAPEHTFLSATQVFGRYGWGRSKGYKMLKTEGFPPSIGGSYRLDSLLCWEARVLAGEVIPLADWARDLDQELEELASGGTAQDVEELTPTGGAAPQHPMPAVATLPTRRRTRGPRAKVNA